MKIPEIRICPVREWFRLLDEHSISVERTAAIICSSFNAAENKLPPIHLVSYFDDVDIWSSPHYHPNPLVFRMLLDCLDMPGDSDRLDLLTSINRRSYRNRPREGG